MIVVLVIAYKKMITRVLRRFATTKTYGNLKDSDRIFTNVYKDSDPYIQGALRRVHALTFREIGIAPRISSATDPTGLSIKSNYQGLEVEVEQVSPLDSNIPLCPKSPPKKDLVI